MTKQPAEPDPDQTVSKPGMAFDPDATVSGALVGPGSPSGREQANAALKPASGPDPDATVQGPALSALAPALEATDPGIASPASPPPAAEPDPEATVRQPLPHFDADATVRQPVLELARAAAPALDADATLTLPAAVLQQAEAAIAVPAPGRRRNPFAPKQSRLPVQANLAALGGLNRLIAAANPILGGVPHVRHALHDPNAERLLQTLRGQIEAFETNADEVGVPAETVAVANFALCALLDESAAATPWGGHWLKAGLLRSLHGEEWGGEKFFMLLAKMAENPAANRELLEFFYVCLALGYEGRYRGLEDGRRQLDEVRARTYEMVRRQRTPTGRVLSESWRAASVSPRPAERGAPGLWAIAGVAVLVLIGHQIWGESPPAQTAGAPAQEVAQARSPAPPTPTPTPPSTPPTSPQAASASSAGAQAPSPPAAAATIPTPAAAPTPPASEAAPKATVATPALAGLAQQFNDEIKRGLISVTDHPGGKRIEIRSDGMFISGGTRLAPQLQPVLLRIADALEGVPGTITVTGHTDSVPIATARFPSNLELSVARAQSAVQLMSKRLSDPQRMRAEGRGASEPIAPNDSEANRARNRRIVIALGTRA